MYLTTYCGVTKRLLLVFCSWFFSLGASFWLEAVEGLRGSLITVGLKVPLNFSLGNLRAARSS